MFASFASIASVALLAVASFTSAAPIPRRRATAPATWATDYLEPYDVYHARYDALDCRSQHNTTFFAECCHPDLKGQSLDSKPSYCIPSSTATASSDSDDDSCAASSSDSSSADASVTVNAAVVIATSSSTPSATPTTSSVAVQTSSSSSSVAAVTTSSSAAAAATTSASSSSSEVETGGHATFFWQNGNPGACGNYNSDSTPLVALSYKWWGTSDSQASSRCGQYVEITRVSDGAKVKAIVADLCPTCTGNGNSLDLSWGAFSQIATAAEGEVDISWTWVN